jgi:hypothetical protein
MKIKILIAGIALLCLFTSIDMAFAKWKYRVTPLLRNSSLYYPESIPNTDQFRSQFQAELNAVYRWEKWFKVVAQPVATYDPTARKSVKPIGVVEKDVVANSEQTFLDLREAYMQFRFRPFTLTMGNQIFSWGVTDGFSPTDVVNSRRLVSPLSSEKIGAPAATISWIQGDFDLELLYIPLQRRSILPGEDSRWLPRSFYVSRSFENTVLKLPNNVRYYYLRPETIDSALHHNFGARLRSQLGGLDLSFIYFEGATNSPAVNLSLSGTFERLPTASQEGILALDPNVGLRPVFFKKRVYGGTLVYPIGDVIVKLESAFTKQISQNARKALPGDFQEHVASLEYDFPISSGKLTSILQGTYSKFETASENGTTSLSRIFEGAVATGLRYSSENNWAVIATTLWDTKYKGAVYVLSGDYKPLDNLTTSLSASVLDGQGLTPLGTYRKNDLATLTLRYDF